ncbi:GNAT family N-acetyltransferase [Streptomyces sp. NPDC057910]|uniref:GNAT family N-acetyltransferase n=1 Tax=Streptomyces sp. NPDC057910 TaxID=3346278 RepID=UPI0036E4BD8F
MIEIETPRLRLRRFRPDDAAALAAYRSDPDIARYQIWESPLTLAGAAAVVERYMSQEPDELGWFQYGIELHDRPGLVGDLGTPASWAAECAHPRGIQGLEDFHLLQRSLRGFVRPPGSTEQTPGGIISSELGFGSTPNGLLHREMSCPRSGTSRALPRFS